MAGHIAAHLDGVADAEDLKCFGPFDDEESSYATGIPGDNIDDPHSGKVGQRVRHGEDSVKQRMPVRCRFLPDFFESHRLVDVRRGE